MSPSIKLRGKSTPFLCFDASLEIIRGIVFTIFPQDREGYAEDLEGVFSGKSTRHSYQYRIKNRYGDYVWVECKGSVKTGQKEERIFAGLITRLDVQSLYDPLTGLPSKNQFYEYDFLLQPSMVRSI